MKRSIALALPTLLANVLLLLLFTSTVHAQDLGSIARKGACPDGWEPFKEEKCFKLIESTGTQSFPNAEKTCEIHDNAKLVSVLSAEEQHFLEEYLFELQGVVDNVWLGARSDASSLNTFIWQSGGTKMSSFTNWAAENPKNQSSNSTSLEKDLKSILESCVQMHAEKEQRGQWSNEPCARRNLVACERAQSWSSDKIRSHLDQISVDHSTIQDTIAMLLKSLIPIGLVYVQLPYQATPQELWPWMKWADDSAQYESAFFRVAGSKAATFGAIQEEFCPYIDEIKAYNTSAQSCQRCTSSARLTLNGGWTENLVTAYRYKSAALEKETGGKSGKKEDGEVGYWNIHTAAGEVRPRNMAVRIWRRTA